MMLPTIHIIRIEDNFTYGTFGVLTINTQAFCVTLEPKEFDNAPNVSCIPAGCYEMKKVVSFHHASTYEICNVPNRTAILFHRGNIVGHTKGCVLLGQYFAKLKGKRGVLNSGKTFNDFMSLMDPYKQARLIIKEAWA